MSAITENQDRPLQSEDDDANASEFQRLKADVLAGHRRRSKMWRKEAERAFNFVASDQWSDEDKALLASQNRPAVTFNRCAPLLKAVCGLEVNNRQGVIYLPRKVGDTGMNEMVTAAAKWVRDETQAEDEESEMFRDCTICGEGWTETRMCYEDNPEGKIIQERIDPLEMGVNSSAFSKNYSDARLIYRVREMDPADARALLELDDSVLPEALDAKWFDDGATPVDGGQGNKRDYPSTTRAGVDGRGKVKTVRIIQVQYWVRDNVHLVVTEGSDELQQLNDANFKKFKERADKMEASGQPLNYEHASIPQKKYYEAFLGQGLLVKRPMKMNMFQFKCMTGERDRKNRCFYGMLRDMFDPQMWANKWLSQSMHILNTNAKGGLLAETDAFQNVRKAERDWADNTKIVWVKPGSLAKNKVKERQAAPMPQGLDQLMMFAISSIRDVTGVNLELLGQADREQAASLEQQRRQSAMTILATLFDNLRRYRKDQGRLLLHFVWLLPEGTLIRIVEEGQSKYIPLVKQGTDIEKFDIIIDEAPNSPDQKQFVWAVTAQILQMGILPPAAIIELLKYSPYPESVVAEIRKALGLDGQMPPDQLKTKLDQAEQALQVLEGQLKEAMANAKTAEDQSAVQMMKLEIDEYKAETDRLKAQWEARIKAAGIAVDKHAAENATSGPEGTPVRGTVDLPPIGDIGHTGAASSGENQGLVALGQKVDQLAEMLQQLLQGLGGQQQAPDPVAAPPTGQDPPGMVPNQPPQM